MTNRQLVIKFALAEIADLKRAYKLGKISLEELQRACKPLDRVVQFAAGLKD